MYFLILRDPLNLVASLHISYLKDLLQRGSLGVASGYIT